MSGTGRGNQTRLCLSLQMQHRAVASLKLYQTAHPEARLSKSDTRLEVQPKRELHLSVRPLR
jgi:hypothetical protein